jgi:release factor glutamine methyltransferase
MLPETWTILRLLKWTTSYFKSHDIEQPRVDAEVLLADTLGLSRTDLYVFYDRPVESPELARFRKHIERRLKREPVAYIVGRKEFWSMALKVTPDVLIPRPETETLVEAALKIIPEDPAPKPWRIWDLGTGSGAIILALASERPGHRFYGTDRSEKALAVARDNARMHQLDKEITWLVGDWFDVSVHRFSPVEVIVSNPPYISNQAFDELPPEIADCEPREALEGGPDGLNAIRLIVRNAQEHMVSGGRLLFEIGCGQWPAVQELIRSSGDYRQWGVFKDYSGHDRVVYATAMGQSVKGG